MQSNELPVEELIQALCELVDEINTLIGESQGVAGFHLNGDIAFWEDLLVGGRAESLIAFDKAKKLLQKTSLALSQFHLSKAPLSQVQPSKREENWIPWKGGPCPLKPLELVSVKLRFEQTIENVPAFVLLWHHIGSSQDILFYLPKYK